MNIILQKNPEPADLLILPLFREENPQDLAAKKMKLALPKLAAADFKNDLGATQLIYTDSGRVLLLGLGSRKQFKPESLRVAIHSLINAAHKLGVISANLFLPNFSSIPQYLELTGFAAIFSSYQFNRYQTDKKPIQLDQLSIIAPTNKTNQQSLQNGVAIGLSANTARDLANHPGNVATPTHLAKHAVEIAKKYNLTYKILGPKEITKEGMGLLMGVSQGSDEEPRFIILEYRPKAAAKKDPIVLIGKGLTFDSGGISIKPADKMEEMKFDMCGGATVLGILEAVARLKLPVHIVGLIPSSENLVSGSAIKPGDVLVAHDQTSVEIINTDAEGRLVLADAISFAQKYYKPRLIIDFATLTGAVLVALGDQYTGYFANTRAFDQKFQQASSQTAEQFWPLPLAAEYRDQLKSTIADIKNIGEKGSAGATTAALFLQHFIKNNTPWIHLDIAGTAWTTRPKAYASVGATAWGVYLSVQLLRNLKS